MSEEIIGISGFEGGSVAVERYRHRDWGLSTSTATKAWRSDIKRWTTRFSKTSDSFTRGLDAQLQFTDPTRTYLGPGRLRDAALIVTDEVRVLRPAGTASSMAFWGQFATMGFDSEGHLPPKRCIGFFSEAAAAPGHWRAFATNSTRAVVIDQNLGVLDNELHELRLIYDGLKGVIQWEIDGVLKYETVPPTDIGGAIDSTDPAFGVGLRPNAGNTTIEMDCWTYSHGSLLTIRR